MSGEHPICTYTGKWSKKGHHYISTTYGTGKMYVKYLNLTFDNFNFAAIHFFLQSKITKTLN